MQWHHIGLGYAVRRNGEVALGTCNESGPGTAVGANLSSSRSHLARCGGEIGTCRLLRTQLDPS